MPVYEYKVMPAPNRGVKAKGVRSTSDRFAHGLEVLMNDAAAEGWEYLRAEALPCEERQGLRGRVEVDQHVLVFRRAIQNKADAPLMPEIEVPTGGSAARGTGADPRIEPVLRAGNSASPGGAMRLGPALGVGDADAGGD